MTHLGALPSPALLAFFSATPIAHLSLLDMVVIAVYFGMVIWIGFYLKGKSNTSEEFFMAGREMTAWIAGLSFVSANLGSLELMGWAGSAYQYGILATHWYWIGAIPAMLFLGLVMMPFYYVSQDPLGPRLPESALRRARAHPGRRLLCHRDDPDERREYVRHGRGDEGRARLEPHLQHSDLGGGGGDLRHAGRLALGHLQRGNAVRADLGRRAAGADPGPDPGRQRRAG